MASKKDREIREMKNEIWQYETDVADFKDQLTKISEVVKYDPDNANAKKTKEDLEIAIREFNIEIETLKAKLPAESPKDENAASVVKKPKADIKVGDHVLAHRNDEPRMVIAKVISITGSAQNAVYQIRFKDKFLSQVRADEVRPATKVNELNAEKKRKAEEETVVKPNPNVITAQPQLKKEPSLASAGPDRPAKIPRKLGSEKKLERARGTWQQFQSKQKNKKESMFRSGDSLTSRVGFLGSGRPMTQTDKRVRHVHGEILEE